MHDARLLEVPDLEEARRVLRAYVPAAHLPGPAVAAQTATAQRILAFLDAHPQDAHRRSCLEGHLTASALLWDHACERVLLTLHAKLNRWLQFGGHCDGNANLFACAWRETEEESGITPAWMSPNPVDVDIHTIPARPGEPEHLHLDVRFLARAPRGAQEVCSSESKRLGWFTPGDAQDLDLDDSVRRLFELGRPR